VRSDSLISKNELLNDTGGEANIPEARNRDPGVHHGPVGCVGIDKPAPSRCLAQDNPPFSLSPVNDSFNGLHPKSNFLAPVWIHSSKTLFPLVESPPQRPRREPGSEALLASKKNIFLLHSVHLAEITFDDAKPTPLLPPPVRPLALSTAFTGKAIS
jgi:hypothetical protein